MLDRVILIAAITASALPSSPAASPSPVPAPAASPALKTIASVRASARCAAIITHANGAIDKTLNNDRVITQTIATLRMTNLDDGNEIHRRNGLNALGDLAKTLMLQARSGDDEVKRLRDIAAKTTDPDSAKALKSFADELGGALWRQQKIARDLNGYLAYVDFHDMSQWSEADQNMNRAVFGVNDPLAEMPSDFQNHTQSGQSWPPMKPHLGHDSTDPTATQYAKQAADDFQKRIPDIVIDENHAATHVDGALGKC
jgi:hypothetical protein